MNKGKTTDTRVPDIERRMRAIEDKQRDIEFNIMLIKFIITMAAAVFLFCLVRM